MIAVIRDWLTSVVVCSLFLTLMGALLPDGALKKTASFTGGLLLLLSILSPIQRFDLENLHLDAFPCNREIDRWEQEWEEEYITTWEECIQEKTESYISEEARRLGVEVIVNVLIEQSKEGIPVPAEVHLTGEYEPDLARNIEEKLGILPERLVWDERQA